MAVDGAANSRSREQMIEHLFLGELMQEMWLQGRVVEVSRAEVDAWGYDVVLSVGRVTRHVQLKSPKNGGKLDVHELLLDKPSGCVVWIRATPDKQTGRFRLTYRGYGGPPNKRLPDIRRFPLAKHERYASDRTRRDRVAKRRVPPGEFQPIGGVRELASWLFGRQRPA